jgi:catecholate siderophore receptor
VGEFKTGEIGHTVLMGAEYGRQDTINSRIDNVFEANGDDQLFIDFSDPLVIPAFSFSDPARDRASDVTVLSIYAQDQIALTEQFKVILGGRFDSFDIDVSDFANDAVFSRKDEQFSPRFGAIYKPAENVSFYASYSETFLPRSGDQFLTLNLTNSQTEPQGFENKEIGLKYDIQPNLHLTLALFDLEQANFLTQDIIGGDQDVQVNVQGSNTQGFEVQLQGDLTDRWAINAGYTYVDGAVEFPGSTLDQNRTRQTPNNTFSIWNQYQVTDKFSVGAGAAVQDSFFVREDNSVEVPGYTRFDAAAFYDVTDDLRVQLNIENALDIDYFPDAHSNDNITVGAPINARLTVRSTF